ncbi:hypothetical protein Cni_G26712 [Canna indica]|uniref:Uncharacterized protein n=1 Tax=Canna indica TaxID=4628 RepID=A0AAQ3L0A4_9LILI|nr:hypothetical protein Cni_G26712 [Canna indica]
MARLCLKAHTPHRKSNHTEKGETQREMASYSSGTDSPIAISSSPYRPQERREEEVKETEASALLAAAEEEEEEDENDIGIQWKGWRDQESWPRKCGGGVTLEGYVDADGGDREPDAVGRTKSLTDEDLEELKGCLDLGFGFSYEEIPELCNTLPALELCYSMSQKFLDDQQQQQQHRSLDRSSSEESLDLCASPSSSPIANWKISSPGDDPDEVKARLKYWAQAVACTIRLCN